MTVEAARPAKSHAVRGKIGNPREQSSLPLYADITPLRSALEEAVSLLRTQFGLHFLDQIADNLAKESFNLFRCEDVSTVAADDRALIRVEPSDAFALALTALRTGDRNGFWRHLDITPGEPE